MEVHFPFQKENTISKRNGYWFIGLFKLQNMVSCVAKQYYAINRLFCLSWLCNKFSKKTLPLKWWFVAWYNNYEGLHALLRNYSTHVSNDKKKRSVWCNYLHTFVWWEVASICKKWVKNVRMGGVFFNSIRGPGHTLSMTAI